MITPEGVCHDQTNRRYSRSEPRVDHAGARFWFAVDFDPHQTWNTSDRHATTPRQRRRVDYCRKFRTVHSDPASGVLTDDQAVTSFGRGLQASNLAQLPALVNVLNGELSWWDPDHST